MDFLTNPELDLALEYVRNTNKNIFLTGKAGTGKTTFLHKIKEEGFKHMVVTAPTGVAAINAKGMTLHSFFQLPFGLHLPGATRDPSRYRRFTGQKINLIRSIDLLVIDEVSMVRADLLDAVDEVLRRYRNHSKPFGGVQLLMIGDLHQLPPVVKQDEWELLQAHYQTPYFFGSHALQKSNPVAIELKQIFRQSDQRFISLLNKVRNNQLDSQVLETLNSRFVPDFQPPDDDDFITLTSHNATAHEINAQKLNSIPEPLYLFKAVVEGDFPEMAYPTDETLELKVGAQVMFVKNDTSADKRWFNGKIGKITRIGDGEIHVQCKDEPADFAVTPVRWENIRYSLNEKTREVKEDLLGTFTQYPLKLAWAITIHKSQGLTFDRVIIDAQAAFAHGQVYVALSRCKSFEGIILRSRINPFSLKIDPIVQEYTQETERNAPDEAHLRQSKLEYQQTLLQELFSFQNIKRHFDQLQKLFLEHTNILSQEGMNRFKALGTRMQEEVFSVADKFLPQLRDYFSQQLLPEGNENLCRRLQKAGSYFSQKLKGEILPELKNIPFITGNKALLKTAQEYLYNLQKEVFVKNACFVACQTAFSTHAYVRALTNAELDYAASKNAAPAPTTGIPKNIPHPELYSHLLRWRKNLAEEMSVELYEILPTRSLLELVQFLPISSAALRQIRGIGELKLKHFGSDLIAIIEKYCAEKNLTTNLMSLPEPPKPLQPDTKFVSFELYKSGKSIEEIAAERQLAIGTIEGHLAHFVARKQLDIASFLSPQAVEEIARFFAENNTTLTANAKAHFGEKYSYGQLRMVLEWMKAQGHEGSIG